MKELRHRHGEADDLPEELREFAHREFLGGLKGKDHSIGLCERFS